MVAGSGRAPGVEASATPQTVRSARPVHDVVTIFLDVYGLVKYQPCQILGCLLAEGLTWFPLLVRDFRSVNTNKPDSRLTGYTPDLDRVPVNDTGDLVFPSQRR